MDKIESNYLNKTKNNEKVSLNASKNTNKTSSFDNVIITHEDLNLKIKDPVKIYMKEMGNIGLLTRKGEISRAKKNSR